jgi:DNA modification methylase
MQGDHHGRKIMVSPSADMANTKPFYNNEKNSCERPSPSAGGNTIMSMP